MSGVSLAALAVVPFALAQELRWEYDSPGQQWLPRDVSLGNRGSQAFFAAGPFNAFTRVFSSFDASPPAPIWERTDTQSIFNVRVASAEMSDVHVTLHSEVSSVALQHDVVLRKYTSGAAQPDWTFTFPFRTNGHDRTALRVSRDGQRIVAVVDDIWTSTTSIVVLTPGSNVPLRTIAVGMSGAADQVQLSADGRKLYLSSALRISVVDLEQGTVAFSMLNFDQLYGRPAISADGSAFVYGTQSGYKVYREVAGTYQLAFVRATPAPWLPGKLEISDDGSTLVATLDDTAAFQTVTVEALDLAGSLAAGQAVTTDTYTISSTSTLDNVASVIETSADGQRIAVGGWGDGGGPTPEVSVFARGTPTPVAAYDLPGSVMDLDFSSDGRWLVVGSKGQHFNVLGGGGRVSLYSLGAGDCRVDGVPHLNGSVTVRVRGQPLGTAQVMLSSQAALVPTVFPSIGTLYLRRTGLQTINLPDCDANGESTLTLPLPTSAFQVGATFYVQGVTSTPRVLTQDWAAVTVVP